MEFGQEIFLVTEARVPSISGTDSVLPHEPEDMLVSLVCDQLNQVVFVFFLISLWHPSH